MERFQTRLVVASQKKNTKMDGNMRALFVISGSPSSPLVSFFKFRISQPHWASKSVMFSGECLNILSIEGVRFVDCVRPLDFSSCFSNFFLLSGLLLVFCNVIFMDFFCYLSC